MSTKETSWILKLINQVSAPAQEIQDSIDEVAGSYQKVVDSLEEYSKEERAVAEQAIQSHQDLTRMIASQEKELAALRDWLADIRDQLDPLSQAKFDFDVKTAEDKIRRYKEQLTEVNHELDDLAGSLKKNGDEARNTGGDFQSMYESIKNFDFTGITRRFDGLFRQLASLRKAIFSPAALIGGAAVAGLAIGREVWRYNAQAEENNIIANQITHLTGRELDTTRVRANVIEQVYGKDFKTTIQTASNLSKAFGNSMSSSFDEITEGLKRGGMANDAYLSSLEKYPQLFADAGYTLEEFRRIINAGIDTGSYDDLPDAIKNFNNAIRLQSSETRKAMEEALGAKFTDRLFEGIRTGAITPKEALAAIAEEAERIGLNVVSTQRITRLLFGRAGENASGFKNIIDALNIALNEEERALDGVAKVLEENERRALRVAEAKDKAFNSDSVKKFAADTKDIWASIQVAFYNDVERISRWSTAFSYLMQGDVVNAKLAFDSKKRQQANDQAEAIQTLSKEQAANFPILDEERENINKLKDIDQLQELIEKEQSRFYARPHYIDLISSRIQQLTTDPKIDTNGLAGLSGISGAGKSITMNLDITNYFSLADKAADEIERIADIIVGKINDRLKDAVITLG